MDWSRPSRSPVPTSLSRSVTGRVSTKSRGCPFMMLLSTALAALLMPSSRVCNRAHKAQTCFSYSCSQKNGLQEFSHGFCPHQLEGVTCMSAGDGMQGMSLLKELTCASLLFSLRAVFVSSCSAAVPVPGSVVAMVGSALLCWLSIASSSL